MYVLKLIQNEKKIQVVRANDIKDASLKTVMISVSIQGRGHMEKGKCLSTNKSFVTLNTEKVRRSKARSSFRSNNLSQP